MHLSNIGKKTKTSNLTLEKKKGTVYNIKKNNLSCPLQTYVNSVKYYFYAIFQQLFT